MPSSHRCQTLTMVAHCRQRQTPAPHLHRWTTLHPQPVYHRCLWTKQSSLRPTMVLKTLTASPRRSRLSQKKNHGKHVHCITFTTTAMSDDQQIAIPVIRTDDCHAEQPPKDDAAAATCPIQPLKDDASCSIPPPNYETKMSDSGLLAEKDDASSFTPPPNYDAIFAPVPNTDDGRTLPPKADASSAPPPMDDIAPPARLSLLPLDETVLIKANNGLENADSGLQKNKVDTPKEDVHKLKENVRGHAQRSPQSELKSSLEPIKEIASASTEVPVVIDCIVSTESANSLAINVKPLFTVIQLGKLMNKDCEDTDPGVTGRMTLLFMSTVNSLEYYQTVIDAVIRDSNEDLAL
ncbi:uncharacterized protein LOC111027597 [Myzus persicae]|uniref:uncharacterized protein LOC111027597 n=1 Tax=Myzus persicae TaxID=13164 RepID=UPI000B932639|nr:uncharacterized protein LOC111027597 [Myzus persicae]